MSLLFPWTLDKNDNFPLLPVFSCNYHVINQLIMSIDSQMTITGGTLTVTLRVGLLGATRTMQLTHYLPLTIDPLKCVWGGSCCLNWTDGELNRNGEWDIRC